MFVCSISQYTLCKYRPSCIEKNKQTKTSQPTNQKPLLHMSSYLKFIHLNQIESTRPKYFLIDYLFYFCIDSVFINGLQHLPVAMTIMTYLFHLFCFFSSRIAEYHLPLCLTVIRTNIELLKRNKGEQEGCERPCLIIAQSCAKSKLHQLVLFQTASLTSESGGQSSLITANCFVPLLITTLSAPICVTSTASDQSSYNCEMR